MNEVDEPREDRREFFRSVGRHLVLGATGAGLAAMYAAGLIDPKACINESGPCAMCIKLRKGCELPKAVAFRKGSDGRP